MLSFFSELQAAQAVAGQRFQVIFYAENSYYFQYFQHLFESLLTIPGIKIAYITSDKKDAILQDRRVHAFYLKSTLAGVFPRLKADLMIMTMPDLQNFIFKKSASVRKYIYVFHALVSTHQQYRAHAFDHYDVIFCTGPQQEGEIRKAEQLYSLPSKECIAYGYPMLEELKKKAVDGTVDKRKILIAPSWYPGGILNTCLTPLLAELTKEPFEIWIRPHPEFIKRNRSFYEKMVKLGRKKGNLHFDTSPTVYTHLADAGHLITDRSGIALEYGLATERPVLFVDTPLKVQNPDVSLFSIEPLENWVRSRMGEAVLPTQLFEVNEKLQKLRSSAAHYRTSIQSIERDIVFPPTHWQNGISYIRQQLGC